MKFANTFSTKQITSIFVIIMAFLLLSVKPEDAFKTMKILALLAIIWSVMEFWKESARRYKILAPYKKNNYDSQAERTIADYFHRKKIIYNHHPEITVPKPFWIFTIPFVNIRLEPDFFLPEFNVFVEYWGLIDNPEYKKTEFDRKTKLYKDNAIECVSLYPANMSNLDFIFTSKLLQSIKIKEGNNRKWR